MMDMPNFCSNTHTHASPHNHKAARPILSKNGNTLAFIRRIYENTSLVIKDLQTGTGQKGWAIVFNSSDIDNSR